MAVENRRVPLQAFKAGEDLRNSNGCFVKLNSDAELVKCEEASDKCIGVLIDDGGETQASTDRNTVQVCTEFGAIVKVRTAPGAARSPLAKGDRVTTTATGTVDKQATDSAVAHGVALEAVGADSSPAANTPAVFISILLMPNCA